MSDKKSSDVPDSLLQRRHDRPRPTKRDRPAAADVFLSFDSMSAEKADRVWVSRRTPARPTESTSVDVAEGRRRHRDRRGRRRAPRRGRLSTAVDGCRSVSINRRTFCRPVEATMPTAPCRPAAADVATARCRRPTGSVSPTEGRGRQARGRAADVSALDRVAREDACCGGRKE